MNAMTANLRKPRRPSSAPRTTHAPPNDRTKNWLRRAPLMPALIFLVIVTQIPFVVTIVLSFINWNALYPDDIHFAGFANYANVFGDTMMRGAVVTTVVLTVVVVLASVIIGLGIALLLDRPFWGRGIVRTIMIAPFLIVPTAAALVWKHALYNPEYGLFNGALNWFFGLFGLSAPQPEWISDAPIVAVQVALIWQWTPFMMLILLAGLQSKPLDVIEAARMDGAGTWQIFRHITFPHLRRYLELAILLGSIYIVQNFDAVYTITSGGLGSANLPYAIYQEFFVANDYGTASAAGVLVLIPTLVLAMLVLRVASTLLKEEKA